MRRDKRSDSDCPTSKYKHSVRIHQHKTLWHLFEEEGFVFENRGGNKQKKNKKQPLSNESEAKNFLRIQIRPNEEQVNHESGDSEDNDRYCKTPPFFLMKKTQKP